MTRRVLSLRFPTGGLNRRMAYQRQPPYTTPAALNVRPDEAILGRERGGSRPALAKAFSAQLGSGHPIRLLKSLTFTPAAGGNSRTRLVASSNGFLYREEPQGTMDATPVSSTCLLATDRLLQADEHEGKLYIADYASATVTATDGVIASGNQLTAASIGSADIYNYALVITAGGTGANQRQTLTCSYDSIPTGGTFTLSLVVEGVEYTTKTLPYNATAAQVVSRLNAALHDEDGAAVGTVSGSGGPFPATPIVVTFAGGLANQDNNLLVPDDAALTGGELMAISAAITTAGGPAEPGTYDITAIVGTTLTISPATKNASGISFRIQRCPKVYDPVANTLTKWVATTGSVPIGRALIATWRARLVLGGGDTDPHGWDMSRQEDPYDFDYSQLDDAGAVAGSNSQAGKFAMPLTALIVHSDECLITGTIGQFQVMRSDPKIGGRITELSKEIGAVDCLAWCYTAEGYLFWLSLDGLYVMAPGCGGTPQSVSREKLPENLLNIDRSQYTVTMRYDVRDRGLHLFVTPV